MDNIFKTQKSYRIIYHKINKIINTKVRSNWERSCV